MRRIAPGTFPESTIEQARVAVKDLPRNKAAMLGARRGSMTFGELFADWLQNPGRAPVAAVTIDPRNCHRPTGCLTARTAQLPPVGLFATLIDSCSLGPHNREVRLPGASRLGTLYGCLFLCLVGLRSRFE